MDRQQLFAGLRRTPDIEADNLFAYDASDALILDEAGELTGEVVVVGDRYGALTIGALHAGASSVRVHQDSIVGERALALNAEAAGCMAYDSFDLEESLFEGANMVLLQLPRSLDALAEIAELIAAYADDGVRVVAGGRIKHMTLAMNDMLSASFSEVRASRARQKSRVLHVSGPRRAAVTWPRHAEHSVADSSVSVVAHGAAFAGTSIDIGARALIECFDALPRAQDVVDLACGTGVLGVILAMQRPELRVRSFDASAAAIASTRATAAANGVADRVLATRADGLETLPNATADLVLLNPPFHIGATVHTGIAQRLMADAVRVLRSGGELWTVWNSHLAYRPQLERLGSTRQISRNSKFTVTATTAD